MLAAHIDSGSKLLLELFENRFKFNGKSTNASKRAIFKPRLVRDYLQISQKQYHGNAELMCQILGIEFFSFLVIGAHLFKHEWASDADILLGIKNIESTRNGLLLLGAIEKAYDRSRLCFLKSSTSNSFCLRILDPSLRGVDLLAASTEFITKKECIKIGRSVDEAIAKVTNLLTVDGKLLTFGDLEGRPLVCKGKTRPYKRCLNFQAARARSYALKRGWISPDVIFKYSWSKNFDDSIQLEKYLETLGTSFEDLEASTKQMEYMSIDDITPADAVDEQNSDDSSEVS
jgi:hypothetical protein